ncbi:MlaE family ABC transporter permease [Desulfurivibrio dismutans]|uniref:MlaE family ABC transporter permease n=1 Tax=Desulfurivibrio dismutans TaxID=1398908 RepID=UPI0023DB7A37|nr:ABC transporter permease [Desulfurivibrio alkaliphilus]MDF1613403.1 ABC transporter permease [Desulfurivibrio alkaliphilus]
MARPSLEIDARGYCRLTGTWTLGELARHLAQIRLQLQAVPAGSPWRLQEVERLDSFGAMLLWQRWGRRWPRELEISEELRGVLTAVAAHSGKPLPRPPLFTPLAALVLLGSLLFSFLHHARDLVTLLGQLTLDLLFLLRHPRQWPLKELSANVHKVGVKAMPVAALVGFLIGVVLSYLSAMQLEAFGVEAYLVDILGLGIIRELGPVLVAILVAGRSGSAMTAQLGVMRVTEEIDALATMGISRTIRLVLPKVLALTLVMPLLVLWTSAVALLGGMLSAKVQLGTSFAFFLEKLPQVVPMANLYIGLGKGAVFGLLIALVACHFGLRIRPNTESLASNTTASVVTAITTVILVDAMFAVALRNVGVPL